ncbi:hypothetical protein HZA39_03005 [Candidatus Peregrinibacteria bacterium]|nr:hypothetical protein [Candidatus Peregrinibacteria bacterium]
MHEKIDLFIVTGNLGTGKTTNGLKIAQQFEAPMVDPDLIRKELGIQQYRREDNSFVRQKMWEKIMGIWRTDRSVTLCTPYVTRGGREQSYSILQEMSFDLRKALQAVLIRCECSEKLAKERLQRLREGAFDPQQYDEKKSFDQPIQQEEIDQNPNISFLILDTEYNILKVLSGRRHHSNVLRDLEKLLTSKINEAQIDTTAHSRFANSI